MKLHRLSALLPVVLASSALATSGQGVSAVAGHVAFVNGQASQTAAGQTARPLQVGDAVHVGDRIQTQAGSHVHLRMVDNAFVALRPNSQLVIHLYDFDKNQPQASRIRIDLQQGSSRAVSGQGGQAAKHQYRFNTPLAAIGLRGTDYTVVTDNDKTRVSVAQGAIVVAALGEGCLYNQLGPCATPLARELTASMPNAFIEVTPNQPARLLSGSMAQTTPAAAPSATASHGDDPVKNAVVQQTAARTEQLGRTMAQPDVPNTPPPEHNTLARWGRWSALVNQVPAGSGSINAVFGQMQQPRIVAGNDAFTLAVPASAPMTMPYEGKVQFSLVAAEAYIKDSQNQFTPVGVKSGQLEMDFGRKTFSTQLTVAPPSAQAETLQARGSVDAYGRMSSNAAEGNTQVRGLVFNKGLEAAYLFDKSLGLAGTLSGAAQWVK